MANFIITCDSSCDAGKETLEKLGIPYISFGLTSENGSMIDMMDEEQNKKFYQRMREGEVFKTSQINSFQYEQFFIDHSKEKLPIIHISLCEGLSNSINNAREASRNLRASGIEVSVVDATIASLGSYIMVVEAVKLRDQGVSYEEAVDILSEKARHVNTYYTTDTLTYFARGGRLSKSSAAIGNMLHINIVLACNAAGKLRVNYKVIGRKKAFRAIIDSIKATVENPENEVLYCCNAQNPEGMQDLINAIMAEVHFKSYEIYSMGPTIGAHAGPGLLAVFYLGKEKKDF